ncbi:MAG: glutathione S-transferase family protein, partial [Bacteroidota bacterium]
MKPLVTLYRDTNGWCPFCERVWLALELKQIPYQERLINLRDKPDWFLQMCPTGLVPCVLIHTDDPQLSQKKDLPNTNENEDADVTPQRIFVWESLDILKALDEYFPDTLQLMQGDEQAHAEARKVASATTAAGVQFLYGNRNATVTAAEKEAKREAFLQALQDLDGFLGQSEGEASGPFCLGSEISGIDIEMVPTMERWRYQLPLTANIKIYDEERFPHIVRWFQALEQLPAYSQRVAGDAYSWTAVASTFLQLFGSNQDGTLSEETQAAMERADNAACALIEEFTSSITYEESQSASLEAATKILSNKEAIVADCTREEPKSQKEIPRARDQEAADAALRATVSSLLQSQEKGSGFEMTAENMGDEFNREE